jgi:hypothetical protein
MMTPVRSRALAVTRPLLHVATVANAIYAAGIALLLGSSFFRPDWPWVPLGIDVATASPGVPSGLRTIMVLGLVGAFLVHTILRRLLAIADTVRAGDPFVPENVARLHSIARRVLGLEALRIAVHGIGALVPLPDGDFRLGNAFSPAAWLAVLLLFVLAGVFAQGTRLRADLEGTV